MPSSSTAARTAHGTDRSTWNTRLAQKCVRTEEQAPWLHVTSFNGTRAHHHQHDLPPKSGVFVPYTNKAVLRTYVAARFDLIARRHGARGVC